MLTPKARKTDIGTITGLTPRIVKFDPINPPNTPMRPPTNESIVASIRNWAKMIRFGAPIALRIPISLVRSTTVTNIIFVIPMPPTNSEMAATAPSRTVKTLLFEAEVVNSEA